MDYSFFHLFYSCTPKLLTYYILPIIPTSHLLYHAHYEFYDLIGQCEVLYFTYYTSDSGLLSPDWSDLLIRHLSVKFCHLIGIYILDLWSYLWDFWCWLSEWLYRVNSFYTKMPKGISPQSYENNAFWHSLWRFISLRACVSPVFWLGK